MSTKRCKPQQVVKTLEYRFQYNLGLASNQTRGERGSVL